jgi:hypothetical protein
VLRGVVGNAQDLLSHCALRLLLALVPELGLRYQSEEEVVWESRRDGSTLNEIEYTGMGKMQVD